MITKALAECITDAMEAACADIARKHGVTIRKDGGRFNQTALTAKFRIENIAVDGTSGKPAVSDDFLLSCLALGLPQDLMGRKFKGGRATYIVTGIQPSRYKYPITAVSARGTEYKFSADVVREGLI